MGHRISNQYFAPALLAVFAVMTSLPATASAEEDPWQAQLADDDPWKARFAIVSMNPSGSEVTVTGSDEQYSYDGNSGYGLAIGFEYRASRRIGIDFGVISASPGLDVTVGEQPLTLEASADIRLTPVYAAANIYLTPDGRFQLYIGPLFAYVIYENFDLVAGPGLSEWFRTDNGFGYGAVLGLDIDLGDRWFLNSAVRYLDTTLEASTNDPGVGKADLNPTIFSLGFGVRF
jgi:outer membrane protein